jgi:hypothetical protein
MLKRNFLISLLMGVSLVSTVVSAQYFDYHREESPAISWNGVILFDARMLGTGGISLMASPAFAASINPALIPAKESIFAGASYGIIQHEAFQYWGVNEGVLYDPENRSNRNYRPVGLAFCFPLQGLRFSTGWYTSDLLELPSFFYDQQYWSYAGRFPGIEQTFFAAAAFKIGENVDIGLKLDVVTGKRDVELIENWKGYPAVIRQQENHRLFYAAPTIGVVIKISPAWTWGASVTYPFHGKARRTLNRTFESPAETIEISDLKSTDTLYRPACFYLGTTVTPLTARSDPEKKILTLAAEMVYTLWSNYKYEFYSEPLPRDMRNTLVLALGMELGLFDLFKTRGDWFLRVGYRLDPQPVTEPEMSLKGITGGIGVRIGRVLLDVGGIYYTGSFQGIEQNHWVLSGTMQLRLGGGK